MNAVSHQPYNSDFYSDIRDGARRSASIIVPVVMQMLNLKSVVDVGCGDGTWLSVFREYGVMDTIGIDGEYVDRATLQIPEERFVSADLSSPLKHNRTFDLAVSLEVAEHLPESAAAGFVRSLTKLAPVVLFSAAVPFQGGTYHLNERWPDYWANNFKDCDFLAVDCIRAKVWHNAAVDWWYAQNMLLFVQASRISNDAILRRELDSTNTQMLCLVHPQNYLRVNRSRASSLPGMRSAALAFAQAAKRSTVWRLARWWRRTKRNDSRSKLKS